MRIDLTGKIALITGASGGLGRAIARTLAACGADIAVNYYRGKEQAEVLVKEITGLNHRALAVQADITDFESVLKMRDEIFNGLGKADIVVNNAVIQYEWKSVIDQPLADFKSQFDSCVMHSVHTAKAFLPAMYERGWGRFIGINTECSALCEANCGAYSSAKRGMDGLYRVLAKEAGPKGVTVNQISPGWTITDRDREQGLEISPGYLKSVPLNRRGTDGEIADAVLFLASGLSDFITGVNIPVTGGRVMV